MTKQLFNIYGFVVVVLIAAGLLSCNGSDSPTHPKNRTIQRVGETSAGREFFVILEGESQEKQEVKVLITGEEEVVLGPWQSFCGIVLDSIAVDELSGTPALVYIKWLSSSLACHGGEDYYYLVFARGAATTILLQGSAIKTGGDRYLFHYKRGTYHLEYTNATLSIVERLKEGNGFSSDQSGYCNATETQLARSYGIDSSGTTLFICEKSQRTASTWSEIERGCMEEMDALLAMTAWQPLIMSPDEVSEHCRAIQGGL